nr:MAG TPA: hypothetical protein [Caudoviricetes sp.]
MRSVATHHPPDARPNRPATIGLPDMPAANDESAQATAQTQNNVLVFIAIHEIEWEPEGSGRYERSEPSIISYASAACA